MKKRILSFILILVMAIGLLPTVVFAESYGDLTYSIINSEVTITNCKSSSKSVEIPSEIGGYPVTSIGEGAFRYCMSLTNVTMPDSLNLIGDDAFRMCKALKSVTIPNSVTSIGKDAFHGCAALTSVTIPNSVKSIGDSIFYNCSSLESVVLSNNITAIGADAFFMCKALKSVTIPNSVTSIGDRAFEYCNALTTAAMSNSVTSIGEYAFRGCTALASITLSDSLISIGNNAFYECSAFTSVTIPNSVTTIGNNAFSYCTGLTSVALSNSMTTIGNNMFLYCIMLKSVTIPSGITSIGVASFKNCVDLESVIIPDGVTSIDASAFENCIGLESVTMPSSVTSIGKAAFETCTTLKNVWYSGNTSQKEMIYFSSNNEYLKNAKWNYNFGLTIEEIKDTSKIFSDIKAKGWYKQYVDYSVAYGIFSGTSKDTFSPNDNITRAQFVQVLANLSGVDTSDKKVTTKFSDVKSGQWYAPAVKWASDNKIVSGKSATSFDPNAKITREEMCVMLINYANFKGIKLVNKEQKISFADDKKISSWAKERVYMCQMADIVNGKGANKFDPQGTAIRAEAATIFTVFHKEYLA